MNNKGIWKWLTVLAIIGLVLFGGGSIVANTYVASVDAEDGDIDVVKYASDEVQYSSLDYDTTFEFVRSYAKFDMVKTEKLTNEILAGKRDRQIGVATWVANELYWFGVLPADKVLTTAFWIADLLL
jgi:hypothetical protein